MTGSKRPSTSSLRRFITSRPYVPIAELRRRFGLDEPDTVSRVERPGQAVYLGLPEREATKIGDLWARDEIGLELSVEVRAPVVVGIYPMRIARFVTDGGYAHLNGNGHGPVPAHANGNGTAVPGVTRDGPLWRSTREPVAAPSPEPPADEPRSPPPPPG